MARISGALASSLFCPFNPSWSVQSGLSNGASFRGMAVPALIARGTPVPGFVSLCIVR